MTPHPRYDSLTTAHHWCDSWWGGREGVFHTGMGVLWGATSGGCVMWSHTPNTPGGQPTTLLPTHTPGGQPPPTLLPLQVDSLPLLPLRVDSLPSHPLSPSRWTAYHSAIEVVVQLYNKYATRSSTTIEDSGATCTLTSTLPQTANTPTYTDSKHTYIPT